MHFSDLPHLGRLFLAVDLRLDDDLYSPIARSAFGARIVGDLANLADSASGKGPNGYNALRP